MDKTVDALKALYVALGGTGTDFTARTIPEGLMMIATVAGTIATAAATAELPTVSATDNGDVLAVVDGKWAKKTLG